VKHFPSLVPAVDGAKLFGATEPAVSPNSSNDMTREFPSNGDTKLHHRILVVDDEPDIRSLVISNLRQAGFDTLEAGSAEAALEVIQRQRIDLMVLDILLPQMSGFELCGHIKSRPQTAELPIIVISALGAESERLRALNLGAEDYLPKPFSVRELVARVRVVLRRAGVPQKEDTMVCGDLHFDLVRYRLTVKGKQVQVSRNEFRLLKYLASNPTRVYSRQQLLDYLWGEGNKLGYGNIDVHIHRLRHKIEPDPAKPTYLHTIWGVGYRFSTGKER
jgi:DNA-binding response OmpR family regulator